MKPVISPAQALLILIDHYKTDLLKINNLKKLYLSGANASNIQEIKMRLTDPALLEYHISYDAKTISNDPTRRYFETHLAYQSLMFNLDKICLDDLEFHFNALKDLVPLDVQEEIEDTLNGILWRSGDTISKEYASYIHQIRVGALFTTLDVKAKNKISLLAKCSFLSVVNASHVSMPLDIYNMDIYANESKGKKILAEQETTKNSHLGLMKSHMFLPYDDIACRKTVFPFIKPSDQAFFVEDSVWARDNFTRLVHPFSNSISGTMLSQLRVHLKLKSKGINTFTQSLDKLALYSQLSIAAMLYYSGGHSLHEFVAPLTLEATQVEFKFIPGFNTISLESLFLNNNQSAFAKALDSTINYNKAYLLRKKLNVEIEARNLLLENTMVDAVKPQAAPLSGNKRHHFFMVDESTTVQTTNIENSESKRQMLQKFK
ncbi:MAG: hypothetical protein P4L65_02675 [Legionella sp.]|nr:hypothetical protein [Legionella sp.]